jgi:hypothetical protein
MGAKNRNCQISEKKNPQLEKNSPTVNAEIIAADDSTAIRSPKGELSIFTLS